MIILATNNQHKVDELTSLLNQKVYSLNELNIDIEIVEDGKTLYDNALIKANTISKLFPKDIVIADDTGLFVNCLNGDPGIYSARYAGDNANFEDNIDLLLKKLIDKSDRTAYFETVIVVIKNKRIYSFTGKVEGEILENRSGNKGFGYDSVFYCIEYNKSFANLTKEEKNRVSHRGIAIKNLLDANIL